jgi:hypothetical protein
MSLTPTAPRVAGMPGASAPQRVRHQARDVAVMMVFSATSSVAVAAAFLVLAHLSHAGR